MEIKEIAKKVVGNSVMFRKVLYLARVDAKQ